MRIEYPISDELLALIQQIWPDLPSISDPGIMAQELKKRIEQMATDRDGKFVALSATDLLVCKQLGISPEEF